MRKLKRISIVIAIIVIIMAITLAILSMVSHNKLAAQINQLKNDGIYSYLDKLNSIKVPADQNAAVVFTDMLNRKVDFDISDDARHINRIFKGTENNKNLQMWGEARAIIEKREKLMNDVENALKRPYCIFPVNWKMPYYQQRATFYIQLSKFFQMKSLLDAKDKKSDCIEPIYTCIKLTGIFNDKPDLLMQNARYAILDVTCMRLMRILEYAKFSDNELQRFDKVLSDINLTDGLKMSFQREKSLIHDTPSEVFAPKMMVNASDTIIINFIKTVSNSAICQYYEHIGQYGDKALAMAFLDKQIEGLHLSYPNAYKKGLVSSNFPSYAFALKQVGYIYSGNNSQRYETQSYLDAIRTVLAIQAYKNRYNSYPSNLTDLRNKLNWNIPKDLYSGKDFMYKRQNKGFILYSVGLDMKDDGGIDYLDKGRRKRVGDIVWKLEH